MDGLGRSCREFRRVEGNGGHSSCLQPADDVPSCPALKQFAFTVSVGSPDELVLLLFLFHGVGNRGFTTDHAQEFTAKICQRCHYKPGLGKR